MFISYNVSGFRMFISLATPVLIFSIFYLLSRMKYAKKIRKSRISYIVSQILIAYVFIFFIYMFLGLGVRR